MAKISKTTPENGGKKQKKLASELPVDGDAKSLVSSLANEIDETQNIQIDTLGLIREKRDRVVKNILPLLNGLNYYEIEDVLNGVKTAVGFYPITILP